jgi:hypothetical protein
MDLEENFDERHEIFSYHVLEIENENYNVSIQEKYHPLHAPLEGNFNLSCAQFESNDHNEFKDEHKDFIQCNHDENVAANYQMAQPSLHQATRTMSKLDEHKYW